MGHHPIDIEKHLKIAEAFNIPADQRYELVTSLIMIMQVFCDLEHGIDPTSVSLKVAAQKAFQPATGHDSIASTRPAKRDVLPFEGPRNNPTDDEASRDEVTEPSQGSDLLPRI
jgi:hypothetical protein